jgi:hypothetical protein
LRWEPYAIFPCFEDRQVVYYQGRTYEDVPGESTKLFPRRTEAPWGARFWIYNIDELRASKAPIAIVTESILNVISLRKYMREQKLSGAVPVCVFKHYLSRPQQRKLTEIPSVKEICLLYDHDATRSSWEKGPGLADRIKLTIAEMPPGPGGAKNDPNDDVAAAWHAFQTRQKSDPIRAFLAEINGSFNNYARVMPVPPVEPPNPFDEIEAALNSYGQTNHQTVRPPRGH